MEVVPVAAKRQMVLGEPRNKSRAESKLFLVRKLQQSDAVIGDTLVDLRSDGICFSKNFITYFFNFIIPYVQKVWSQQLVKVTSSFVCFSRSDVNLISLHQ